MNITVLPEVRKYTYSNALYVVHVHVHVLYVYSTCTRRSKMMSVLNISLHCLLFISLQFMPLYMYSCTSGVHVQSYTYVYSCTRYSTKVRE